MGRAGAVSGHARRSIALIGALMLIISGMAATGSAADLGDGTRSSGGPVSLWWVGLNRTNGQEQSVLDESIAPDADVLVKFAGNNSAGWANSLAEVKAWYDGGQVGSASNYPVESEGNRNLAFRILYSPANGTAWAAFPAGGLEITIGDATDTVGQAHPSDSGQSIHEVEIEVHIGCQIRHADGSGFAAADPDYDGNPGTALKDPWSWDLSVTLEDATDPLFSDTLYAEFGVERYASISMMGNPSGTAEPGDSIRLAPFTTIEYSVNTHYWVNVTVQDLLLNGVGPEHIPAANLSVRNVHPLANASNSGISGEPVAFAAAGIPLAVWGPDDAPMAPVGNGTRTAGPWKTDFNSANRTTQLEWWIGIPRGTALGTYWATIVITIEPSTSEPTVIRLKQQSGIQVVDETPPVSEVTEAGGKVVSATAYDDETSVSNVTLWYRYSEDNETWGEWAKFGTDDEAPWSWDWDEPKGGEYYEFYTTAMDPSNNTEAAPAEADMGIEAASGIPGFGIEVIVAALAVAMVARRPRRRSG